MSNFPPCPAATRTENGRRRAETAETGGRIPSWPFDGRHRLGRAAGRRNAKDRTARLGSEEDHVRCVPRRATAPRRVAQRSGSAAGDGDRLQLPARQPEPPAVRRPNGSSAPSESSSLRAIDESSDRTQSCEIRLVHAADDERDHRAVGGDRDARRIRISSAPAAGAAKIATPAGAVTMGLGQNTAAPPPRSARRRRPDGIRQPNTRAVRRARAGCRRGRVRLAGSMFAIVTRASPMSRRRSFGSRSRQRSSSCRSGGGVRRQRVQSGRP